MACRCGSSTCTTATGLFCATDKCSHLQTREALFADPTTEICTAPNPVSCTAWQEDRGKTMNGGYLVDVSLEDGRVAINVTVYCHGMDSDAPSQWLVLPDSGMTNFNKVSGTSKQDCPALGGQSKWMVFQQGKPYLFEKTERDCTVLYQAVKINSTTGTLRLIELANRTFADDP